MHINCFTWTLHSLQIDYLCLYFIWLSLPVRSLVSNWIVVGVIITLRIEGIYLGYSTVALIMWCYLVYLWTKKWYYCILICWTILLCYITTLFLIPVWCKYFCTTLNSLGVSSLSPYKWSNRFTPNIYSVNSLSMNLKLFKLSFSSLPTIPS